jgi:glutamate decarboxylase
MELIAEKKAYKSIPFEKKYAMTTKSTTQHIKTLLSEQIQPWQNLGTYCLTNMDDEVAEVIKNSLSYNKVNANEYHSFQDMNNSCIDFLFKLFNIDTSENGLGLSTVGSSEAILLACLNWKKRSRLSKGLNIVISDHSHSAWTNAAKILDIDVKTVKYTKDERDFTQGFLLAVDDNTIGVGLTLGTTGIGMFDPVYEIHNALLNYSIKEGREISIHIDAASGGFVAPFSFPGYIWDFRLELVQSISVSGHKYGFTYPSIGWILWKNKNEISEGLWSRIGYLKEEFNHLGVTFSQNCVGIISQYYLIKRYGFIGYQSNIEYLYRIKNYMESRLSDIHKVKFINHKKHQLPILSWFIEGGDKSTYDDISQKFESLGWLVPYSEVLFDGQAVNCFRIVIKPTYTEDVIEVLINDFFVSHKLIK